MNKSPSASLLPLWTYRPEWRLVWWFSLRSQEETLQPPTLWRVVREDQRASTHCLLCTQLWDWVCSKLWVNEENQTKSIINLNPILCLLQLLSEQLATRWTRTYTGNQNPGVRRAGRRSDGLRQSFSCVNTTGE